MTNNVGVTFSVGDTTPWITIDIEARRLELVTLNMIFSVVYNLFLFFLSFSLALVGSGCQVTFG
jgi:hypothetical protein